MQENMQENSSQSEQSFFSKNKVWLIILGVIVILAVWGIGKYNSLITLSQSIDAQWAQVQTQFQRRFDLIPNLEATIKGETQQEKNIIGAIADARTKYAGAVTTDQKAAAAGQVESALGRLLVITESYPVLQSSEAFRALMVELEGTENRVAVERKKYNDKIQEYNNAVIRFPTSVFASMLGLKAHAYFNAPEAAQTAPKVNFGN